MFALILLVAAGGAAIAKWRASNILVFNEETLKLVDHDACITTPFNAVPWEEMYPPFMVATMKDKYQ